jgi:hypothetical protein
MIKCNINNHSLLFKVMFKTATNIDFTSLQTSVYCIKDLLYHLQSHIVMVTTYLE